VRRQHPQRRHQEPRSVAKLLAGCITRSTIKAHSVGAKTVQRIKAEPL
jgi:hypothetical protein